MDRQEEPIEVVAILACHNRREMSVRAVRSFFAAADHASLTAECVVVDDGSTDGTAAAVRAVDPRVHLLNGHGNWYWSRSMSEGDLWVQAMLRYKYMMWLNDDVVLDDRSLSLLVHTSGEMSDMAVIGGAVRDLETHSVTYAGFRRSSERSFSLQLVGPTADEAVTVDALAGNVLLIPAAIHDRLGPIDGGFAHANADLDYTMRARKLGIACVLAPGTVGRCASNPAASAYYDPRVPLRTRVRFALSRKGIPIRSHARLFRRHAGRLWLRHLVGAYVGVIFPRVHQRSRRR